MSYVDVAKFVSAIRDQKAKYHAKSLKDTAIDIGLTRIFDVGPLLQLDIWLSIPEIAWTALGFSLLYDMPPIAFDPIRIAFEVEIPSITIDIPRDLLEELHEVDVDTGVQLLLQRLTLDELEKLKSIMPPTMRLQDIVEILKQMYPPEIIINLPDIVKVELPNWNAFFQGIYLLIRKLYLEDIFKWLSDLDDFIMNNFRFWIELPKKCVYGESQYGHCFYDPTVWQEMVRGTLLKLAQKLKARLTIKKAYESLSNATETNINVIKYLFNRISMMAEAHVQTFVLGYSLLGVSKLTPREFGKPVVKIIDFDENELDVHFDHLAHLQFGFILGITPLGHGVLLPPEDPYIQRDVNLRGVHTTKGGPPAADFVRFKAEKMIRQAVYTPLAFANYQRPEERVDWRRSERADQYMELRTLYELIDNIVDPILEKHGVNVYDKRVYKNAVRQLIGHKAKRHEWGYGAFRAMDENTFRQWWIEYWKTQGLNEVILEELYNAVGRWLEEWRRIKHRLGVSLKERRLRLAGLS